MDKQTIHLITLIVAIIGSNAWSYASLSDRIGEVENRLSDRIGAVETRLTTVETRLTTVETRLTTVETRLATLETRVAEIDKRLVIVETSLKANNQYIASVLGQRKPANPGHPLNKAPLE